MKVIATAICVLLIGFLSKHVKAITLLEKSKITTKILSASMQCMLTNPLTRTEIKSFQNKMIPEGENPKCYMACMLKKAEIMDDMGMITTAGVRKQTEKTTKGNEELLGNVDNLVESCLSVNQQSTEDGNKGCDRARLAVMCFIENGPKYGFDFKA